MEVADGGTVECRFGGCRHSIRVISIPRNSGVAAFEEEEEYEQWMVSFGPSPSSVGGVKRRR